MVKVNNISGEQTIKALQKLGFKVARQRGSHVVMKKILPETTVGCVVPMHKELASGTLLNILRQAKISLEEFKANL